MLTQQQIRVLEGRGYRPGVAIRCAFTHFSRGVNKIARIPSWDKCRMTALQEIVFKAPFLDEPERDFWLYNLGGIGTLYAEIVPERYVPESLRLPSIIEPSNGSVIPIVYNQTTPTLSKP